MASAVPALTFDTGFAPEVGHPVSIAPAIVRITAPNASAYTFTGTNTFLLGQSAIAVLDPGPDDSAHLAALRRAIAGRAVTAIILTHTHRDHSAAAAKLATELNAPLWFGGPHRLSRPLRWLERNSIHGSCDWDLQPDRTLADGETIAAGDLALTVHATPGHCANHLAFGVSGTDLLLTGDHVMGWNSTLVSVPDGSMADYLASLEKTIALPYDDYLPAHGGPIADGRRYARALLAHRQGRNRQVLAAIAAGARTISAIVAAIYPNQSPLVRRAAAMTITAHVEYLEGRGELQVKRRIWGTTIGRVGKRPT